MEAQPFQVFALPSVYACMKSFKVKSSRLRWTDSKT